MIRLVAAGNSELGTLKKWISPEIYLSDKGINVYEDIVLPHNLGAVPDRIDFVFSDHLPSGRDGFMGFDMDVAYVSGFRYSGLEAYTQTTTTTTMRVRNFAGSYGYGHFIVSSKR